MNTENDELTNLLSRLSAKEYCYLTTTGRVTGKPHEIEIWFVIQNDTLYMLSGGMDKSDWVRNLLRNPTATVRIAKQIFTGTARIVKDKAEEMLARQLIAEKYQEWEEGRTLSNWARTALVVGIDMRRE
jgi:deazaflavin-dependent oxidoreductase (nitroreductase family)